MLLIKRVRIDYEPQFWVAKFLFKSTPTALPGPVRRIGLRFFRQRRSTCREQNLLISIEWTKPQHLSDGNHGKYSGRHHQLVKFLLTPCNANSKSQLFKTIWSLFNFSTQTIRKLWTKLRGNEDAGNLPSSTKDNIVCARITIDYLPCITYFLRKPVAIHVENWQEKPVKWIQNVCNSLITFFGFQNLMFQRKSRIKVVLTEVPSLMPLRPHCDQAISQWVNEWASELLLKGSQLDLNENKANCRGTFKSTYLT